MKNSFQGKPIGRISSDAAKPTREINKARLARETMALLEILALGRRQIEAGEVVPAREAIAGLRARGAG